MSHPLLLLLQQRTCCLKLVSQCIVDFGGFETLGKWLLNLLWHFL